MVDLKALVNGALARIAEADKKAEAASLAFTLGPDTFQAYWEKQSAAALARMEERYRELDPDGANSKANGASGGRTESAGGSGGP